MRIENRTQAFEWYSFQWLWVILSDIAKYSVTWNIMRPLCNSWASCFYLLPSWEDGSPHGHSKEYTRQMHLKPGTHWQQSRLSPIRSTLSPDRRTSFRLCRQCVRGVLTAFGRRETTDQSASRLIDDVMTSTNEEQLRIDRQNWKLWSPCENIVRC